MRDIVPTKGYGKEVKDKLNEKLANILGREITEHTFIRITDTSDGIKIKYSVYCDKWECALWDLIVPFHGVCEIQIDYRGPVDPTMLKALIDLAYAVHKGYLYEC